MCFYSQLSSKRRSSFSLTIVAFIVPFIFPLNLIAQILGPNPRVGGMPVVCAGIQTAVRSDIGDLARAIPGWILLHPSLFSLESKIQLFVYAHECAHHLIGNNEQVADCWAIRTGRDQGWFEREDIELLIRYFGASPGDWSHEPGPPRIARLLSCFDS